MFNTRNFILGVYTLALLFIPYFLPNVLVKRVFEKLYTFNRDAFVAKNHRFLVYKNEKTVSRKQTLDSTFLFSFVTEQHCLKLSYRKCTDLQSIVGWFIQINVQLVLSNKFE